MLRIFFCHLYVHVILLCSFLTHQSSSIKAVSGWFFFGSVYKEKPAIYKLLYIVPALRPDEAFHPIHRVLKCISTTREGIQRFVWIWKPPVILLGTTYIVLSAPGLALLNPRDLSGSVFVLCVFWVCKCAALGMHVRNACWDCSHTHPSAHERAGWPFPLWQNWTGSGSEQSRIERASPWGEAETRHLIRRLR